MKITLETDGEEPQVFETDSFFLYHDKGAMWKGVDTHLCKILELYADKIITKRKEEINGN